MSGAQTFGTTAAELRAGKLSEARRAALAVLRMTADWLKVCGGSHEEVESLRHAYSLIKIKEPNKT